MTGARGSQWDSRTRRRGGGGGAACHSTGPTWGSASTARSGARLAAPRGADTHRRIPGGLLHCLLQLLPREEQCALAPCPRPAFLGPGLLFALQSPGESDKARLGSSRPPGTSAPTPALTPGAASGSFRCPREGQGPPSPPGEHPGAAAAPKSVSGFLRRSHWSERDSLPRAARGREDASEAPVKLLENFLGGKTLFGALLCGPPGSGGRAVRRALLGEGPATRRQQRFGSVAGVPGDPGSFLPGERVVSFSAPAAAQGRMLHEARHECRFVPAASQPLGFFSAPLRAPMLLRLFNHSFSYNNF